jgi:hypothetical protein
VGGAHLARYRSRVGINQRDGLFAAVDGLRCGESLSTASGFLCACQSFIDSEGDQGEPSSACSVLAPPLLARLHNFAYVPGWPNLENIAMRQSRMLANELDSMIHIPRLKNKNAAELFFGFGIGAVSRCHLAVLPGQRQGGLWTLKRFAATPVPVGAKMVVILKACIEYGASLAIRHSIEFAFVVVAKTDVFHCSSPPD